MWFASWLVIRSFSAGWTFRTTTAISPPRFATRHHRAIADRLWFLGRATPGVVAEVLAASDLHLAPEPALSRGAIAAGSHGRGMRRAGSDTAAHREVIRHGQNGLLVDFADLDAVLRQAIAVLDNPDEHRPLGHAAAELVQSRYSQEVCLPVLAERFSSLGRHACPEVIDMHVLFLHDAFPAQFGRLGLELKKRYGWRCSFLVQSLSSCPTPTPEMLRELELQQLPLTAEHRSKEGIPWPQIYGVYLEQCESVYHALRARPELEPDLVVAHGGRGAPTLFLKDLLACPIVNYCEYYFANSHRDISYRIDLPPAEPAPFFPRCINAPTLAALVDCDAGYSATSWQKQSFPARFQSKIEVYFDGIDTELYHPGAAPRQIGELTVPEGTKVVTFVSRGLESIRGFDLFMEVADRICRELRGRSLRRGRRRGDSLRLGQTAYELAKLQEMGSQPGSATTSPASCSPAASCPSNLRTFSA